MKKIALSSLTAVAALLTLSACDHGVSGYDCNEKNRLYSKQMDKDKAVYCAKLRLTQKEHSHPDGTVHIHEGGDVPHYHEPKDLIKDKTGVFHEDDNDYDRASTLGDLKEDDQDIIEWRQQQKVNAATPSDEKPATHSEEVTPDTGN